MRTIFLLIILVLSIAHSQYSIRTEQTGGAMNSGETNNFKAVLMKNGTTAATVERTIPFDVPFPSVTLNETTGMFVLNYTFDGFAEVYGATGKKLWEQNFFKEKGPNYERTITVAMGNTTIAFLTSDVTLPNASVHLFTVAGKQEWETALPHAMGYEIAMSTDERTIVAGSYFVLEDEVRRAACVLNRTGTITGSADILFRTAAFSGDGTMIAFASEREVSLYSIPLQKETARGAHASGERLINSVVWQGEELIVQESSVKTTDDHQFYFTEPAFIRFNKLLEERSRRTIDNVTFKRSSMLVRPNGVEFRPDSGSAVLVQ